MFKEHPKGLYVLFFSNMGERFGYYTMLSIFILFLEARFGLSKESMGMVWSAFLFCVYFLPLFGGMLADRIGYISTVTAGILLMVLGYGLMAVPSDNLPFIYVALFVIALGTGFFKGNLVVILGNLYDKASLTGFRDAAFSIYYMGINVGAFFSPYAATASRDFFLARSGFTYDARLPGLAHNVLSGVSMKAEDLALFRQLAEKQGQAATDLAIFAKSYTTALADAYNTGFAIAAVSIILSFIIFMVFKKHYREADVRKVKGAGAGQDLPQMSRAETKQRIVALVMVFFVVIFFWMAFHQNGLTLTMFAKSYVVGQVGPFEKVFFDLPAFLSLIGAIASLVYLLKPSSAARTRLISAGALAVLGGLLFLRQRSFGASNEISPELFQSFNPIFVVFLTPVVIAFFSALARKGKEPSSPRKIGFGMIITAMAYVLLVFAASGLASPASLESSGGVSPILLSPNWLIGTYLVLTVAELFLSPMGLSFVAKVSPPKYRGMMQGGWLAATAVGNMLSGFMTIPYASLELWQTYLILVATSLLSAIFMFWIISRLKTLA